MPTNPALIARLDRAFNPKVVAVVGFTDSDSVLAAGPVIQKAGIPFITAGATSPKLPDQIGDMMYLACFGDNFRLTIVLSGVEHVVDDFSGAKHS